MKLFGGLFTVLALLAITTGCSTTKGLVSVPPAHREAVFVRVTSNAVNDGEWTSLAPRPVQVASASGDWINPEAVKGIFGLGLNVLGMAFDGPGEGTPPFRERTDCEPRSLVAHLKSGLSNAQIPVTSERGAPIASELRAHITSTGLRKVKEGKVVPYARVSAQLINSKGKTVWHGRASSQGNKPRASEDYHHDPAHYAHDFQEVASDLARQLIEGVSAASSR